MTDLIPPTAPATDEVVTTEPTVVEVVATDPTVDETPTVDLTTEAPPRRRRRWLPIPVLVLAIGAVVGASVVAGAADDDRSSAERAERRADERLAVAEAQAQEQEAELDELTRPARQFLAVADEAVETADRAARLDVEEMVLNRSSVQYGILGSVDEYNGVIDKLNVQRNDQYQAALELWQLLNRLRAIEI